MPVMVQGPDMQRFWTEKGRHAAEEWLLGTLGRLDPERAKELLAQSADWQLATGRCLIREIAEQRAMEPRRRVAA